MLFRAVLPLLALAPLLAAIGMRRFSAEAAPRPARVLMYHGIPSTDAAGFERQMGYLRACFDVVPLSSLVPPVEDRPGRMRIALTFDDGLRNNVSVAYPILRKLGLPATFFVCPQLIDRGQWLWNQQARQRLKRLDAEARKKLALEAGSPSAEVEPFIDWMKSLEPSVRRTVEASVRKATPGFRPTFAERDAYDISRWEELRGLDPQIVTIGSHTLTHPILTTLTGEELETEIGGSRVVLEDKLQRPVELFAYPNGAQNPAVLACARRHYRGAVLAGPERVSPAPDPHLIPRDCAPRGILRLARNLLREMAAPEPLWQEGSRQS
ncbi:MAG TPA: polysaccharide deacetylase family protein [Burkholderiales bacterium]